MVRFAPFAIDVVFSVVVMILITLTTVKAEMILEFDHHRALLAEVELATGADQARVGFFPSR
jgi:hypothetical protein